MPVYKVRLEETFIHTVELPADSLDHLNAVMTTICEDHDTICLKELAKDHKINGRILLTSIDKVDSIE